MKNVNEINQKVEARKIQFQKLYQKDDENYDLWVGKEQIFDTHKMAINVTGTEMVSLGRRAQASAIRSRLDIHVLPPKAIGNDNALEQANQEERLYQFGLDQADERLSLIGETKIRPAISWQAIVPGRIIVRVLVYKRDGKIVWDILPLIPRFVTFEFDSKGLSWYAYETFRSPASIKSEYGKEAKEEVEGRGVCVIDYWDREHNVRYLKANKEALPIKVGGKTKSAWEHGLEEVPALIVPVAGGPRVVSNEGTDVTMWGQSVFDSFKNQFRTLNKLRSIAATQEHLNANRPLEVIAKGGSNENVEENELSRYPGATLRHSDNIELKPLEATKIEPTFLAMMGEISTGIQRVTGADLHPEWAGSSGAALRIAGQDRQDVNTPIIDAINSAYTRMCKMIKHQAIKKKLTIPVKTVVNGEYHVFDIAPKQLNNDFYVSAELVKQDVYDEVEAVQTAQMLKQNSWASDEYIMEKILRMQDVPAEKFKIDWEKIKAEIPELVMKDMSRILIEEKNQPEDAEFLKKYIGMMMAQKMQELQGGQDERDRGYAGAPFGAVQGR